MGKGFIAIGLAITLIFAVVIDVTEFAVYSKEDNQCGWDHADNYDEWGSSIDDVYDDDAFVEQMKKDSDTAKEACEKDNQKETAKVYDYTKRERYVGLWRTSALTWKKYGDFDANLTTTAPVTTTKYNTGLDDDDDYQHKNPNTDWELDSYHVHHSFPRGPALKWPELDKWKSLCDRSIDERMQFAQLCSIVGSLGLLFALIAWVFFPWSWSPRFACYITFLAGLCYMFIFSIESAIFDAEDTRLTRDPNDDSDSCGFGFGDKEDWSLSTSFGFAIVNWIMCWVLAVVMALHLIKNSNGPMKACCSWMSSMLNSFRTSLLKAFIVFGLIVAVIFAIVIPTHQDLYSYSIEMNTCEANAQPNIVKAYPYQPMFKTKPALKTRIDKICQNHSSASAVNFNVALKLDIHVGVFEVHKIIYQQHTGAVTTSTTQPPSPAKQFVYGVSDDWAVVDWSVYDLCGSGPASYPLLNSFSSECQAGLNGKCQWQRMWAVVGLVCLVFALFAYSYDRFPHLTHSLVFLSALGYTTMLGTAAHMYTEEAFSGKNTRSLSEPHNAGLDGADRDLNSDDSADCGAGYETFGFDYGTVFVLCSLNVLLCWTLFILMFLRAICCPAPANDKDPVKPV